MQKAHPSHAADEAERPVLRMPLAPTLPASTAAGLEAGASLGGSYLADQSCTVPRGGPLISVVAVPAS